jgi:hypothetical protein
MMAAQYIAVPEGEFCFEAKPVIAYGIFARGLRAFR